MLQFIRITHDRLSPSSSVARFHLFEMSDSSSETETKTTQRSRKASSSGKEDSNVGSSSGGCQLKKGPWTSAEDAILMEYVTIHGEGNWNAVQKYSGLSRCGKSCRLRWANHLRPDLKKGSFNPEEEKRIIELHAKMGNKWARMAAELPGRTDNEIKNFWNTRIKRLQRAGLPIYPPDIRARAMNESLQYQDIPSDRSAGNNLSDTSEINYFDIPAFDFKKVGLAQGFLNSSSSLLNLPAHSILCKDTSSALDILLPVHPHKRPRETETTYPSAIGIGIGIGNICDGYSEFDRYDDIPCGNYGQSIWSPSFDPDLHITGSSPVDILSGSHAHTNGNPPSSEPLTMTMKMELPSLQLSASQVGSWGPSSPLPSLESVDLIQSPLSEQTQSNCPLPSSNGLLDAVVYESHLKKSKNNSSPPISEAPISGADLLGSSSPDARETKWDVSGDSVSPFSQSAASVLLEYNTPLSGSSSDEPQSAETMQGFKGKAEMGYSASADSHGGTKVLPPRLQDLRPDILLDSCWFGFPGLPKEHSITDTDDIGSLFADDLNFEYAQVGSLSAESNQSNALESSSWEYTSDLFQFSDHL
ncbi:hypothetical protein V2J09_018554 [Rumex salicifolius]